MYIPQAVQEITLVQKMQFWQFDRSKMGDNSTHRVPNLPKGRLKFLILYAKLLLWWSKVRSFL